jgi:hypothetical protein
MKIFAKVCIRTHSVHTHRSRLALATLGLGLAVLGLLPLAAAAQPACVPRPAGLVGWWRGEGDANDSAGTNNGALQGGATFASGEVGQAFSFNPVNGTVIVPDSSSLRLTNQLTIEAWINTRSTNTDHGIVSKVGGAAGNNGYEFGLSGNKLVGQFNSPGQGWPSSQIMCALPLATGAWQHVAWTYDQSAMKLYFNGQPVATNVIGTKAIVASSSTLRISGDDGNHVYFDGLIDEPALYNRALSASEIQDIYNAGSEGKCTSVTTVPAHLTVCAGSPAVFSVGTMGEGLTYQWRVSCDSGITFTNISDTATNASYTNLVPTLADNGNQYQIIITLGAGALTSAPPSVLTVNPAATADVGGNQTICATNSTTVLGGSVGGAATGAVWSSAGTGSFVPDATTLNAVYTPSAGDIAAGTVTLTLSATGQLAPCAATAQVVVTIQAPPAITSQPASRTNCPSTPAIFSVSATGTGLSYQWQVSGDNGVTFTNISDTATNASYTNPAPTMAGDEGKQYQIIVSGTCNPPQTSAPPAVLNIYPFPCATTTLGPVSPPQTYGNVQLNALVLPPDSLGTVTFKEGTNILGTGNLDGITGMAVCSPIDTFLTVPGSPYSVYAVYSGDERYPGSTSASSNLTIIPRPLVVSGTMTYSGAAMAPAASLGVNNNLDGTNLALGGYAMLDGRDVGPHAVVSSTAATPARQQFAAGAVGSAPATNFTVTLPSAPTNGDTLVAVITTRGTPPNQVTSVTNDNVSTWRRAVQVVDANWTTTEIWYAPIAVTNAGATITIYQATSLFSAAVVLEYAGVVTLGALDRMASATGYGHAVVTGTTLTTAQPNELWVGGISFVSSDTTLGSVLNGFTSPGNSASGSTRVTDNADVYALEFLAPATGSASSGGTLSIGQHWSGAIATFLPMPGLTLTGSAAANYTATGVSGTVTIDPVAVTVMPTMETKVYDGTTNSARIPTLSPWLGSGDSVVGLSQAFTDRNVGSSNKTLVAIPAPVTISDGNSGLNYSQIAWGTLTGGTITPKPLIPSGLSPVSRQYDGTTLVALTGTPALLAAEAPGTGATSDGMPYTVDSVSVGASTPQGHLPAKYVGFYNGTVTYSGLTLTGAGSSNYTMSGAGIGTATITPAVVQLAKTYDGTTGATAGQLTLVNNADGTNVTLSGSGTQTGRNVGSQGLVTSSYAPTIRVQAATGHVPAMYYPTSPYLVTLSQAPQNGNTLVAVISSRSSTGGAVSRITQASSISGSPNVTWIKVVEAVYGGPSGVTTEIWYATNLFYAGTSVSIALSPTKWSAAVVAEYSGILTYNAVDRMKTATGYNAYPVTGYVGPTTQPTDLLVGGLGLLNYRYALTVTNTYTVNVISNTAVAGWQADANIYALESFPTSTGTYQLGGNQLYSGASRSDDWAGAIVAFKAQNLTGLTLGGSSVATNYTLYGTTMVTVVPTNLTVTAAANTKTYDGGTNATTAPTITVGGIQTGDSAPNWTETYDNKHVGTGKTLSPTHLVVSDGNSGSNYNYTYLPAAMGEIDKTNLTVTATTNTKPYDGNTSAAAVPNITAGAIQPGDSAPTWTETYADVNVGANKTLIPAGVVSDGNGGANYAYTYAPDYSGVVTGFEIAVPGGQPANQSSCLGSPATFCVTALEQPPLGLSYQWQVSADNGNTFTNISDSATNACYTNLSPRLDQSGYQYQVIITQTGGASLTSAPPAVLTVGVWGTASAGGNQTICSGSSTAALEGSVGGGATGGQWSSSGTGTFLPDATTLNATYSPSAADITVGTVTLTLTATGNQSPCVAVTAQVVITIHLAATASAGGNQTICAGSSTAGLSGSVGGGAMTGLWTSSGSGTLAPNATTLDATYSPSADDIAAGAVTLTLTSTGQQGPCGPATAHVVVSITALLAITEQPTNLAVCSGSPTIFWVRATGGALTYQWQVSQDGGTTFTNISDTATNAYYTNPITAQSDNGSQYQVIVNSPCNLSQTSFPPAVLTVELPATASNGGNQTLCGSSSTGGLGGMIGGGATGGLWTSSGSGTFLPDATTLNATYTPSAADAAAGTVTLTLTTTGQQAPCGPVTAQVVVAVLQQAAIGATTLLEGPSAGTDSIVLGVNPVTGTWSATAHATWLHLSAANQRGTGSTNVVFSYDANPGATRTGTLTIACQTLTVTQAGAAYLAAPGPVTTLVASGLSYPHGVAVDGAGDVYIAAEGNNQVKKWTAANNTVTTLIASGLYAPFAVALDGAANLYIADYGNSAIKKWTATNNTVTTLVDCGSYNPMGATVDGAGNVYFTGYSLDAVRKWTAANNTVTYLVASGLNVPWGVAVDGAGNVYFADSGNAAVKKWTAANNTVTTLVSTGLVQPTGIAVDGAGNVYIANTGSYSPIKKWTAANNTVTTLVLWGPVNNPIGMAVDGAGNVYIGDYGDNTVKELPRAFVDPTPKSEGPGAGSDTLPVALPPTANLRAPFAPTSDQPWLTITGITNGVVSFAFEANTGSSSRTANITLLGQPIAITQAALAPPILIGPMVLEDGTFQLTFSNSDPGVSFTVLTTTNPSLPLAEWTVAGPATNIAPGLFQFSTAITNNPQGYYRVRSP